MLNKGGSVSIVSSDPWLQPAIDLNLLDSDFDIQCMKEAVRASQEFLEAPSLSSFVHRPFGGAPAHFTQLTSWRNQT